MSREQPVNSNVVKLLRESVSAVDDFIDARWRYLKTRFGWDGVPKIQPYIGYANDDFAWFHGRVLTNPPRDLPSEDDTWWDNLSQMYRRFESDEVPGVKIEIEFAGKKHHVITDDEGYFHMETANTPDVRATQPWKSIGMRILDHPNISPDETATFSKMLTPSKSANFGIISDIDDTVLHTGITGLLTAARLTFLHNARTRKPLAGVGTLYNALQDGLDRQNPQRNPIFYVSSSPWNLFDLLEDFLVLNNIPAGPILLRDLGFDQNKFLMDGHEHKLEKARKVMAAYPKLPFLLFGDSGQEDAQLYAQAAVEKPEQVKAIFIRDVDPTFDSPFDQSVLQSIEVAKSAGVPMYLVADSFSAAKILHQMQMLSDDWLPNIERSTSTELSLEP